MAEITGAQDSHSQSLSDVFERGLKLYKSLQISKEPTNSEKFQEDLKKSIDLLEDATRKVSMLGIFSTNESIEELPTADLKYLLLPALLGDLTLKLVDEDRKHVLESAEVYFLDFLKRCQSYSICDVEIPETNSTSEEDAPPEGRPKQPDLLKLMSERDEKIKRFTRQKDLTQKLEKMEKMLVHNFNDEILREYHLSYVKKHVDMALDEFNAIKAEKPLLEHKLKHRSDQDNLIDIPPPKLKPVIITKNELQKKIYGAGYPSLPSMTVDEFVDQKMKEGTLEKADSTSLYAKALSGVSQAAEQERYEYMKEREIERDDPDELRRKREWDDWKDDHRRGFGNRKNMG